MKSFWKSFWWIPAFVLIVGFWVKFRYGIFAYVDVLVMVVLSLVVWALIEQLRFSFGSPRHTRPRKRRREKDAGNDCQ